MVPVYQSLPSIPSEICKDYQITPRNSKSFFLSKPSHLASFDFFLTNFTDHTHFNFEHLSENAYFAFKKEKCVIIRKYSFAGYEAILIKSDRKNIQICTSLLQSSKTIELLIKSLFDCFNKHSLQTSSIPSSSSSMSSSSLSSSSTLSTYHKPIQQTIHCINEIALVLIFTWLNPQDYFNISVTNRLFQRLSKHKLIIASLFNNHQISWKKTMDLVSFVRSKQLHCLDISCFKPKSLKLIFSFFSNLREIHLNGKEGYYSGKERSTVSQAIQRFPKKMASIYFTLCEITITDLKNLPAQLTSLHLSHCHQITNTASLCFSSKLQSLHLSFCNLITEVNLNHLQNLTSLTLSGLKITTITLANLSKLEYLELSYNHVLKRIDLDLPILKHFFLINCSEFTHLIHNKSFLNLESFELYGCKSIDSIKISQLKKLKFLDLSDCTQLDTIDVEINLSSLEKLIFSNNAIENININDDLFPNLKSIDLSNNQYLLTININSSKLKSLDLSNCINLNEVVLTNLDELEFLNLSFSNASNKILKNSFHKLKFLDLRYCDRITEADADNFAKKHPSCLVEYID